MEDYEDYYGNELKAKDYNSEITWFVVDNKTDQIVFVTKIVDGKDVPNMNGSCSVVFDGNIKHVIDYHKNAYVIDKNVYYNYKTNKLEVKPHKILFWLKPVILNWRVDKFIGYIDDSFGLFKTRIPLNFSYKSYDAIRNRVNLISS